MGAVTTDLTAKPQQGEEALRREVRTMLHLDSTNPGRLLSRENSQLEYKATFNWGSRGKYAKSMAAFANNIGGFIVFGVKNSPHDIVGVNSKRFNKLDPSKVATFLNSAFAPELDWEAFQIKVSDFTLGIFGVRPAVRRPVICTKTHGKELREADIYYRYRGSSERIKFPELEKLLAERQDRERDAWLEHLSHVARIGIENVGVLDLVKGQLSGPGGRLLVAEELLDRVQFIREGRFVESLGDGIPTLRLVGDVQPVVPGALTPVKTIKQPLVIGEKEIMGEFLHQTHPQAPKEYIKQACRELSPYMPVYHFARVAGLDLDSLRDCIEREPVRRNRLLDRIRGKLVLPSGSINSDTPVSIKRRRILRRLEAGDMHDLYSGGPLRLYEAVTHFRPSNPPTELLGLLRRHLDERFNKFESHRRTMFRKAVAHLDEVLNRPE